MKTTANQNSAMDYLREELRQTALKAFEADAIDAISLKSALNLSSQDDALDPDPRWGTNKSQAQLRLEGIKEKIQKTDKLKAQPGAELHKDFIFYKYGEPFDVRPILEILDIHSVKSIISTLDTVMFYFIYHLNQDMFDQSVKSDFYNMRDIRNAFMRASNQIELESWLENRTEEQKEQDKIQFNLDYLRNAS